MERKFRQGWEKVCTESIISLQSKELCIDYELRSPSAKCTETTYFAGEYVIHIGDTHTNSPSACSPRT